MFHNVLHGFQENRGKGTTSLEANILQHLAEMCEEFLYEILLYICKAYNVMDRERCLDILERYSIGPSTIQLL